MISELQFNNTQIIEQMNEKGKITSVTNWGLGSLLTLIAIYKLSKFLIKTKLKSQRQQKARDEESVKNPPEDEDQKQIPEQLHQQVIYQEPNQTRTLGLEGGGVKLTNY